MKDTLARIVVTTLFVGTIATVYGRGVTPTPLPTDPSIAIAVGVAGYWESAVVEKGVRFREYSVDLSSYKLDEEPAISNLLTHEFATSIYPKEKFWYLFSAKADTVRISIDITDQQHRLGQVVVTDLISKSKVDTIESQSHGYRIDKHLTVLASHPFFRFDGFDLTGRRIFTLGMSTGEPLQYAFIKVVRYFQPQIADKRKSKRYPLNHNVGPSVGDRIPYTSILKAVPVYSVHCFSDDTINNTSSSNPYNIDMMSGVRKKDVYGMVRVGGLRSRVTPPNPIEPDLATLNASSDAWFDTAPLELKPYSDNVIHADYRLRGVVEAYICVPYRIWKNPVVARKLQGFFDSISKVEPLEKENRLDNWKRCFIEWLNTPEGKASGLDQDMVGGVFRYIYQEAERMTDKPSL